MKKFGFKIPYCNSLINPIFIGDDAIAVKSGVDYLGREFGRVSENIVVRDMILGDSTGLAIGSEMSGGVRNVTFQNITTYGTAYMVHLKTQRGRGG